MVTALDLDRCVWQEAQRYLNANYSELAEMARRPPSSLSGWRTCCGEEVYLDVALGEWGLRKRVSVELTMTAGENEQSITSIVYFERFRSGKIRGPWRNQKGEPDHKQTG